MLRETARIRYAFHSVLISHNTPYEGCFHSGSGDHTVCSRPGNVLAYPCAYLRHPDCKTSQGTSGIQNEVSSGRRRSYAEWKHSHCETRGRKTGMERPEPGGPRCSYAGCMHFETGMFVDKSHTRSNDRSGPCDHHTRLDHRINSRNTGTRTLWIDDPGN